MGRLLESTLRHHGFSVTAVPTAALAFGALAQEDLSLMTVDLQLPDLSGLDLIAHVRERSDIPIIVITGHTDLGDVVTALAAGADDYLVKPIQPSELGARAIALTRRLMSKQRELNEYSDANLRLDFVSNRIERGSHIATMTNTERRLLRMLVSNAGRVLTHDDLLRGAWGVGYEGAIANLHVFVNQLRKKLEPDAEGPRYIETHRGVGYRFVADADAQLV
jgi:two-component system KDP operon response regulator KdpE